MKHSIFLVCIFSYLLFANFFVESYLGVNWGRLATQRMIPSMVVDMLLQNGINDVQLFSASDNVIEPFGGTNISLAITMPNADINLVNTTDHLMNWITVNVEDFIRKNVSFRYIFIGTQPLSSPFSNKTYPSAVGMLGWMGKALIDRNLSIKATMAHYTDILIQVTKPSAGDFRPDIKHQMLEVCDILYNNNAPFGIDIHPLNSAHDFFNSDIEFGFFENNSTSKFTDGGHVYSNVFEVMYDTLVYALEKNGYPNMTIVVGEVGWPTDAIEGGTVQNAQRFHQGLAKFIASNKGTPKRPGPIHAYIHNLADENAVNIKHSGPYIRHWGIYKFDGQPKFNVDFEGKGSEKKPVSAIGITHMPKRWCIVDNGIALRGSSIPYNELDYQYMVACNRSDCSAALNGGSCSNLEFPLNISYGFNMGFQARSQQIDGIGACKYGGYGVIVADDPSTPNCRFPVEIIAAENPNYYGIHYNSQAFALRISCTSMTGIVQYLFILLTFMCAGRLY